MVGPVAGDQADWGWAVGGAEVWQALPYLRQSQETVLYPFI